MVPLDVGDDAAHVHLALEGGGLARAGSHVVHDILDVGLAASLDYKGGEKEREKEPLSSK